MNINLDYEGKNYNFDIPKDAKLDYLKDLSSKLFKSDKTLLELISKDNKIIQKNENIFIQDLIPKGQKTTILTVQMREENKKEKFVNQKVFNQIKINEELKIKKNELNQENNNNIKNKIIEKDSNNNNQLNDNNLNKLFENKIFIANYIKKSNELFSMMKDFNDKIKQIDNNLNRKMKNFDLGCDNNIFYYELTLFEKRIIDFQKRQINFYKELIQILNINNEGTKQPNFDLLYHKLLLNEENLEKNDKNKIFPKINNNSIKKYVKDIDNDLSNRLPMIKNNNKKYREGLIISNDLDKIKDKQNEDIHRTIEQIKKPNKIEKMKFKNKKSNRINVKTENKNIDDNLNENKEIKNHNDSNKRLKEVYIENSISNFEK